MNRNLHRCHVLHSLSGLAVGGIATVVLNNVKGLDDKIFHSTVIYVTPRGDLLSEYQQQGVEVICLGHKRTIDGIRTIWRAVRLIMTKNIDLIHTNHPLDRFYFAIAGLLTGRRVITTLHNTSVPRGRSIIEWSGVGHRVSEAIGMKLSDHFVAVSRAVHSVQSKYWKIPNHEMTIIHSGVNAEPFMREKSAGERTNLKRSLKLDGRGPILVTVGRLHRHKGHCHLVSMMSEVLEVFPKAALLIAGEGEERERIQRLIRETRTEEAVFLLGKRRDIPELLDLADIFVFASLQEGLGLAVVEAALAGLPVVGTDIPALNEVVERGQSGYLVAVGNPSAMAQSVLQLLSDSGRAERMGRRGRAIALERFSLSGSISTLETLYGRYCHCYSAP